MSINDGFVYFIGPEALLHREDSLVKIGFTKSHPKVRLANFQTGSPEHLVLWAYTPGGLDLEKAFHATFANLNSHGEWFYVERKLECLLCYLGDEPDIGNLISRERLEDAIHDNIFSNCAPHPSISDEEWQSSASPECLASHFPDLWLESEYHGGTVQ